MIHGSYFFETVKHCIQGNLWIISHIVQKQLLIYVSVRFRYSVRHLASWTFLLIENINEKYLDAFGFQVLPSYLEEFYSK